MAQLPASTPATGRRAAATDHVEWITLILVGAFLAAFALAVVVARWLPWPVGVALFAVLGAFQISLQHEVLHGHPTPWQRVNESLVHLPAILWLPYPVYSQSHRQHHASPLTVPGTDPESHFVTGAQWRRYGPVRRALLTCNQTLPGRLLIAPPKNIARSLVGQAAALRHDAALRRIWAVHLPLAVLTWWLVVDLGGVRWWVFLLGYIDGGLALTYLRSFAEHLPVDHGTRSAMVRSNRFWGTLFLNNNLHHAHHERPDAAWFDLPRIADTLHSDQLARQGAGWYPGYAALARRFLVRPIAPAVHPATTE